MASKMDNLNIIFPMAGGNNFFNEQEYPYPKPLIEIFGTTMIGLVIKNFSSLEKACFNFILDEEENKKFHLSDSIKLICNNESNFIQAKSQTKGAACSAMLAIDNIGENGELIIANSDQLFDFQLDQVLDYFRKENADAGVITHDSAHPRWSYVLEENGLVIESQEKRPISKSAICGFYYFKKAKYFFESSESMILKGNTTSENYYISPCLNEMILRDKRVLNYKIENNSYHTFYSPQKITEYELTKTP